MADDVVIRAEGLGKKYMIGHAAERERYVALRDTLSRGAHNLWRKTADMVRGRAIVAGDAVEEFWALKNVSFEVKRGEVLGIIGRNGAGKSTLLKILSRITEPSEGRVTIRGRVASLLEVGTGFHSELTGRENIYLNGAILGMTHAEIRRKFDEIIAFAEVENFLDTPVKRYSSGMYVRLAFAVAAHLEPEILVVDEVLAVGDYNFQQKCAGKMRDVSEKGGRTVLFVSHNLNAIASLCNRCILLLNGRVEAIGQVDDIVRDYRRVSAGGNEVRCVFQGIPSKCKKAFIKRVELNSPGNQTGIFDFAEQLSVTIWYELLVLYHGLHCTIEVGNHNEMIFVSFDTDKDRALLEDREPGSYRTVVDLPRELLKPGMYHINVGLGVPQRGAIDRADRAIVFEVGLATEYAAIISYAPHRGGVVAANIGWRTERLATSDASFMSEFWGDH
jgi:homopolymeric O-antigen transport system ATP-binding protein